MSEIDRLSLAAALQSLETARQAKKVAEQAKEIAELHASSSAKEYQTTWARLRETYQLGPRDRVSHLTGRIARHGAPPEEAETDAQDQ